MVDDEIFYTDKLEEKEAELNINPLKQNFIKIQDNVIELECMIDILLKAIDNEFDTPHIEDIEKFIFILKEHIIQHGKNLEDFVNTLQIPDTKGKLISLSHVKFK